MSSAPTPSARSALRPRIRELRPEDRPALANMVRDCGAFNEAEQAVALELIDAVLAQPAHPDYRILVADEGEEIGGHNTPAAYICWGPNPVAQQVAEVYWIAADPARQGRGYATALLERMEELERAAGTRLVVIETAGKPSYQAARGFYLARAYTEEARVRDFYAPGDDKVVFRKAL